MEREKERWRERERRSEREGESGLSLMVVLTAASPPTGSNTINPPKQSQRERRKLARNKEINLTTLKYIAFVFYAKRGSIYTNTLSSINYSREGLRQWLKILVCTW